MTGDDVHIGHIVHVLFKGRDFRCLTRGLTTNDGSHLRCFEHIRLQHLRHTFISLTMPILLDGVINVFCGNIIDNPVTVSRDEVTVAQNSDILLQGLL